MKKFIYFITLIIFIGSFYSCKKTNKRKLSNDWTVQSMTSKISSSDVLKNETTNNNSNESEIRKTNDKIIEISWNSSQNYSYYNNGEWVTSEFKSKENISGIINSYDFIIKKEGTWEKSLSYTYTTDDEITYTIDEVQSGIWEFLDKTDDFKKNERVKFNLTSNSLKTNLKYQGESVTYTDANNISGEENSTIFVVIESSRKELHLSYEGTYNREIQFQNEPNYKESESKIRSMELKLIPTK